MDPVGEESRAARAQNRTENPAESRTGSKRIFRDAVKSPRTNVTWATGLTPRYFPSRLAAKLRVISMVKGRLEEARTAIESARRLGTRDARMLYYAGMIALASGDRQNGRRLLQESLALNPRFDLLQARRAREALAQKPDSSVRRGGRPPER